MDRNKQILYKMIAIYCHDKHLKSPSMGKSFDAMTGLCKTCSELALYADQRLDLCPQGIKKPNCNQCKTQCYKPDKKHQIREIMRYSGPRMIYKDPSAVVLHLFSAFKRP